MRPRGACRLAISLTFDRTAPAVWTFDDNGNHNPITQEASFVELVGGFRVPCYPYGDGEKTTAARYTDVEIPQARRQYLGVPITGRPRTSSMELTLKLYLECGDLDLKTTGYEVIYARGHLWFLRDVVGIGSIDGLAYYDTLSWSESIICRAEGTE